VNRSILVPFGLSTKNPEKSGACSDTLALLHLDAFCYRLCASVTLGVHMLLFVCRCQPFSDRTRNFWHADLRA